MNLNQKQTETKIKIELFARLFDVDPLWAVSIAMVESSLGVFQKSPTSCAGVFQMSTIAMKDLLQSMFEINDDLVDIVSGIAFLRLLKKRWGTEQAATDHYCDPNDRSFYWNRVLDFMHEFKE